jgi:hypothetical protein
MDGSGRRPHIRRLPLSYELNLLLRGGGGGGAVLQPAGDVRRGRQALAKKAVESVEAEESDFLGKRKQFGCAGGTRHMKFEPSPKSRVLS